MIRTIGLKQQYVIYGSNTLAMANLIYLANISTTDLVMYQAARVEPHHQMLSSLVHFSCQKKTAHAMHYKSGGLS